MTPPDAPALHAAMPLEGETLEEHRRYMDEGTRRVARYLRDVELPVQPAFTTILDLTWMSGVGVAPQQNWLTGRWYPDRYYYR